MKSLLTSVLLLGLAGSLSAQELQGSPHQVRLRKDARGALEVLVDGQQRFALEDLREGRVVSGISLQTVQGRLVLHCSKGPLQVQVDDVRGWSGQVEEQCEVSLHFNPSNQTLQFDASAKNARPVQVRLPDGVSASIAPNSGVSMDLFKDSSYVMNAHGSVIAVRADGVKEKLSEFLPGLVGGAATVATLKEKDQPPRMDWVSPQTTVVIRGDLGKELSIQVGDELVRLEGSAQKTVYLKNGASLTLSQDAETRSLSWEVSKGHFDFEVDGIAGWKATGSTGTAGNMQWDIKKGIVDLKNVSSEGHDLVISLPTRTFVKLGSKTTFQYGYLGAGKFTTSAVGASATLYNPGINERTELLVQNLMVVNGQVMRPEALPLPPPISVGLSWDNNAPLELNGTAGSETVRPDELRLVQYGENAEAVYNYSKQGFLTVTAKSGRFNLSIVNINGMTMTLEQGDTVKLGLDLKQGTFMIYTDARNTSELKVFTEKMFNPVLKSDMALNFNIDNKKLTLARSANGEITLLGDAGQDNTPLLTPSYKGDFNSTPVVEPLVTTQ